MNPDAISSGSGRNPTKSPRDGLSSTQVLPIIPVFNAASALGVPFVDRTVRVGTLADAIVAGLSDDEVEGVQRFPEMDALAETLSN